LTINGEVTVNRLITRSWRRPALAGLLALALLLPATATAVDSRGPIGNGVDWLRDQQLEDGGFPGFDGSTDPAASADAALAFAAAGVHPGRVSMGETSLLDYLESVADAYSESTGGGAKLLLAAVASGADPRSFGGVDLIDRLEARLDPDTGLYDEQLYSHALAVLALAGAGAIVPDTAIGALLDAQIEDGSWSFLGIGEPGDGDTNTTAIVLQALAAAGARDEASQGAGIAYLESARVEDGSYMYAPGIEDPPIGDANSTALAVQARIAIGLDDESNERGIDALLALQNDTGAWRYRDDFPDDNLLATVQAIPALAGSALPVRPFEAFGSNDPLATARQAARSGDPARCDFHEVTEHNVCHGFRDLWHAGGGLAIFGYPLTEEFDVLDETGERVTVQYFERARFEYRWLALIERAANGSDQCTTPEGAEFAVCEPFLGYWMTYGGVDTFGLPITEIRDWNSMAVQYFERARFEWQPDVWPERFDVLLGRLGAEELRRLNE
jgi:hypothetical protein